MIGRYFHIINLLLFITGTVASRLHHVLSSYYPFPNNMIFKKDLYSGGLQREKRRGRSFPDRPETSVIVQEITIELSGAFRPPP